MDCPLIVSILSSCLLLHNDTDTDTDTDTGFVARQQSLECRSLKLPGEAREASLDLFLVGVGITSKEKLG
jgi:hypothetical protein